MWKFPVLICLLGTTAMAAASEPVFVEQDGYIVMEMESLQPVGSWELRTSLKGYTGQGYFYWDGGNQYGGPGGPPLSYRIFITTPGRYSMALRSSNHGAKKHDLNNDLWAAMDGDKAYKVFNGGQDFKWGGNFDHHPEGKPKAYYDLTPGEHVLTIHGRSQGFQVDRIALYLPEKKNVATDIATAETRGIPLPPPELADERMKKAWLQGYLGPVWKWAAKQDAEVSGAAESVVVLEQAFEEAYAELPTSFEADPLAGLAKLNLMREQYAGAPREGELKDLAREWSRDKRLKSEMAAQKLIDQLRKIDGESKRRSGTAKERMLAQVEQGKQILSERFGDTVTAQRYLGGQ